MTGHCPKNTNYFIQSDCLIYKCIAYTDLIAGSTVLALCENICNHSPQCPISHLKHLHILSHCVHILSHCQLNDKYSHIICRQIPTVWLTKLTPKSTVQNSLFRKNCQIHSSSDFSKRVSMKVYLTAWLHKRVLPRTLMGHVLSSSRWILLSV